MKREPGREPQFHIDAPADSGANVEPEEQIDADDEPDWTGILLNKAGDLGREVRGAEMRLEGLRVGSVAFETAQQQIAVLKACLAIKLDKAKTVEIPALKKNFEVLRSYGTEVPDPCLQVYSMRITNFDMEQGIMGNEPQTVLATWAVRVLIAGAPTGEQWELQDATFQSCQPNTEDDNETYKFAKTYHQAVFNEGFIAAFKQASKGGVGPGLLIMMAEAYCDAFAVEEAKLQPWQ